MDGAAAAATKLPTTQRRYQYWLMGVPSPHVPTRDACPTMNAADICDADGADDPATEQLHAIGELLFQASSEATAIEEGLTRASPSAEALKEMASSIPTINGTVDRLQTRVDAVSASSESARKQRRLLTEQSHALSERVQSLPAKLDKVVAATATSHKEAGNVHFKKGEYDAAIKRYSEAIDVDRKNAAFYSNRVLPLGLKLRSC